MIEELTNFWESEFNSFAPVAHNLKDEFKDRWVRFHSLPESKRYPEREQEYLEVFYRHNTVLTELCGTDKVLVVLTEFSESEVPSKPNELLADLFNNYELWCSIKYSAEAEVEFYWHLYVCEVTFTGSELNDLFRLVANDEVSNIMVIIPSKKVVFHPYDGGADIILESATKRDLLKENHTEWLSPHISEL